MNFALHADIIGGTCFSADYPGHMREEIKKQIPNCEVIYVSGAAGDINHIDAMHPENMNGGYEYSKKVGLTLAKEILKTYKQLKSLSSQKDNTINMRSGKRYFKVPLRRVSSEEVCQASALIQEFNEGKWETKQMSDVAKIASAFRTIQLSESEDSMDIDIQALVINDMAFVAFPGEIFVDIGRRIKKNSCYANTFISSISNGYKGYFPTKTAFYEGGYETQNSMFTPELEELLVNETLELLDSLK